MPRNTSTDKRPRLDCSSSVKSRIRALRASLMYTNDSEVIAYLLAVYDDHYEKITLPKDKQYREKVIHLERQQSLF
ncbi:hypothetical protein M5X00_24200 [Paenibacillus alvei]|uniref:Uncharacterized protein n=1 Tax=Paenibacillus alvei TaxID=44250 RepID=A0ABT4GR18_PAEAL|nr:hypothetical protein [Paenibacillus alvei]MCY9543622.1 hypothetical protein [Paenibacillus alvei]MCY9736123.1 hypothetical protein [Paenibacillus alvei]MCY9757332.1 hypothetical protein [Paenibacillus alvei]MCY9759137.1 hypothetical protein [Paenibacillus alvei]MCY9770404.1 hypothetical protein [Paenibacillus alvei]